MRIPRYDRLRVPALLLALLLLAGCAAPAPATQAQEPAPAASQPGAAPAVNLAGNLTDGCIDAFDPNVDYFPEKVSTEYSIGFTVGYHNSYKVVTVPRAWAGSETPFRYVLVQCGAPTPEDVGDAQVVQVPVEEVAALTTTVLPHLVAIGVLDRLRAVEEFDYVNTQVVRDRIASGDLIEVGGVDTNVEYMLDMEPDIIFTFGYGDPVYDTHPKLLEAGLNVALVADYLETAPLGRAEWIKYVSLFFNREATAADAFGQTAEEYNELAALAQDAEPKPTVFTGVFRGDSWRVSGGRSYFARFLADAGAQYLWAEDESTGSVPLDFESVFDRAGEADFWLPNTGEWLTPDDIAAADERYTEFAAFANGGIYNNNGEVNEFGGNNYWEMGIANPNLVLADLIAIFHPDLLPDHELRFFRHIAE